MKRFWLLLALLALLPLTGLCAEPVLVDRGLDLGSCRVHWPEVTGLEDAETEDRVNRLLREISDAEALTGRMALLMTAPTGLDASWEGLIRGGILSCVHHAEGPLRTNRLEEQWGTAVVDLTDGEPIRLSAFFTDAEAAVERLAAHLEDTAAPVLSAHLLAADLTPLPETYAADPYGLLFCYPASRLTTLSGRAGTLRVYWYEAADGLDLSEGSPAVRMGAAEALTLSPGSAAALLEMAAQGQLPLWPAALDEPVRELISRFGLLSDPDLYLGGRYVELQDDRFRGVMLMTDALGDDISGDSLVQGIRADRFGLLGLRPGLTRTEVRAAFGQPDASILLDADQAEAMRLAPGESDYYLCGAFRLRLHYDAEDRLAALILSH